MKPLSTPPNVETLRVGGIVPFSTVDYPGWLSAVVFCQGCPWRCRYCHNAHLRRFRSGAVPWDHVVEFMDKRRGRLEAIVFSGGEPTAQPGIENACRTARALGFRVGLHTAGAYPEQLRRLIPLIDWVGLDVKAPFDARYDAVTGRKNSWKAPRQSLDIILSAGVPYQLRTTVHRALLNQEALDDISSTLAQIGTQPTRWQTFRPQGCKDEELVNWAGGLPGEDSDAEAVEEHHHEHHEHHEEPELVE